MLLYPFDENGRIKVSFVALFISSVALFLGLAMFQTAYGGYESPWWLPAGIFLFLLVMMIVTFGMRQLQRKADSRNQEFVPVGRKIAGPMVLAGGLLLSLGLLGILFDFSVWNCVGKDGCGSLTPQALPAFLAVLMAGLTLLAIVFGLATRGMGRKAGLGTP